MQYSDLLSTIKTVDQARALSSEIDVLLDGLFKTPPSGAKTQNAFEDSLNAISARNSQLLKEALARNDIGGSAFQGKAPSGAFQGETLQAQQADGDQTSNPAVIKEYLLGLKEQIQKLKVIKLALSFEPKRTTVNNLFAWVSQNLGNGLILEINVDKTILGGAIIEFEGKYADMSLNKKLEEVFGRKRGR